MATIRHHITVVNPKQQQLARLKSLSGPVSGWRHQGIRHGLIVLTEQPKMGQDVPGLEVMLAIMKRRGEALDSLQHTPVIGSLPEDLLLSWIWLNPARSCFEQQSALCKALKPLLEERPEALALVLTGQQANRADVAGQALHVVWLNGVALPTWKKIVKPGLQTLFLQGAALGDTRFEAARAVAEANTLARTLTLLPPNELTPGRYRQQIRALARSRNWRLAEYSIARLKSMGANAFVAVAQGSAPADGAIVHLQYRGPGARKQVALVGKGICFDTGGHNLKPAKYMYGMHEDMNGSAVALGILSAISRLRLPLVVDCWVALAQNHISPRAYKQNDVVTALNGTTIEIVHTDAEGRMVLADTLTLAARRHPDLMLDFATLTGSMHTALGSRFSGIFASDARLAQLAVAVGDAVGERVVVFPSATDYDVSLDSKVADIKQCTMDGAADHILAARFLSRFTADRPWVHMDLSASRHEGGLGAVGSDITGFGVNWGVHFLDSWLVNKL
ncbi:MAG: leucyl aminopeptidase family protein [Betaproteobacteria bacterium]|nr:leucyl aminopeptidase family protein [Betaproteobacteria bacterium]